MWRRLRRITFEPRQEESKAGAQLVFQATSPEVSRVTEMTRSKELERLIDPEPTKLMISGPSRAHRALYDPLLPEPEAAKRIVVNIFLAESPPQKVDQTQWTNLLLHRRKEELNALKSELKVMTKIAVRKSRETHDEVKNSHERPIRKKNAYAALYPYYEERVEAVKDFFSVYIAAVSNTVTDISKALSNHEVEESLLLAKRDFYLKRVRNLEAKRDELTELAAAAVKDEPFFAAMKELFEALKSSKNYVPMLLTTAGYLGLKVGDRIKLWAKVYLSHFETIGKFMQTNFPTASHIAYAALGVGGIWIGTNILRKLRAKYKNMKANDQTLRKLVRIKRIIGSLQANIQSKIERPRDLLYAKKVLTAVDLPDGEMRSDIEAAQAKLHAALKEACYPIEMKRSG